MAEFYEKRIEGPVAGQPRWAYSVALDEHNERFPPETTQGLVQSFARKKDAKQFAAKCAVQWLMDQKLMPSTVKDADIPKQQVTTVVSPPPKRQKVNATSPSSTPLTASANISAVESAQSATVSGQGQPSKGTRSRENRTPSPTSAGKEAAKLVAELCTKLGVMPPTYKIELEQGEFGSGHAQFHDPVHPQEVPRVLGHVSGVYGGKKNVKEAIAEQILKELRLLEEKRDAMLDELLATGGKS